jgi:DNA repair protein RecN (Recombination protein N)
MLKSLSVKNYALIDELEVEFSSGLVIITGETGAGKSILIDALGLILGSRTSAEIIRSGTDKAVVEGTFAVAGNKKLRALLEENDLEVTDDLIVRREVSAKAQSRCFINDSPVTLALQKQVGELLVDLHGQHEHQSLLRVDTHIGMLDDFGGLDGMVGEYQSAYKHLRDLGTELGELRTREQQLREKQDFYAFQMQEIDAVGPQPGEEERLEAELKILENAEKLFASTGKLYEHLYEGEQSIHDLLVFVRNQLQDLTEIDRQFAEAASECESAVAVVSELAKFIQGYNARVEFNPERLDELRERLGRLSLLKKKYGGSLEAVLAHREQIAGEVALAENFDAVIRRLTYEVGQAREECSVVAQRLSAKRYDVARKMDRAIAGELQKLGIRDGRFTTRIIQRDLPGLNPEKESAAQWTRVGKQVIALNNRGYDEVEFYLSANAGEEERPLSRVASGGEVSRIMLALKSVLAKSDRLPVLIFDEIDVGVSGRIAQAVGLSLKSLSHFHQVIAITHLPQIAGLAESHFVVFKKERGGRTSTSIRKLALDEQVREVATLMSGTEITEAGLEGARELMGLK